MCLVDDPDERLACPPQACRGCGAGLAGQPVTAQRRHQVTDITPAPAPKVTEYVAQAQQCPCCGRVTARGIARAYAGAASYGPETCAQAANLTTGHHIPIWRSTLLLCQLAGIAVSTGWMAQVRGKAADLVEASGFPERVRELLKTAPAIHADETPARAAAGTRYVHPVPDTGRRRPRREPVPAHRHRRIRPPHRPPVPVLRGPDPPLRYPP